MDYTLRDKNYLKERIEYTGVHPQKFLLWLAMASMTMFFAALTSALIVKKGDIAIWESFKLPSVFTYSTVSIVLVSVFIHLSLVSYRKSQFSLFRLLLASSFIMACIFLALQYTGWGELKKMGFELDGNLSGSFVYLISAMHGAHIIGGLVITLFFLISAIRSRKDPIYELKNIANPKRQFNLELLVSYWHYIDVVWVYLFVFLYLNYQ